MKKKEKTNSSPVRSAKETQSGTAFPSNSKSLGTKPGTRYNRISLDVDIKRKQMKLLQRKEYKPAKLYTGKDDPNKKWFFYYHFRDPITDKFVRFKEYFEINREKKDNGALYAKNIYGKAMLSVINDELANGFSPFKAINLKAPVDCHIEAQLFKLKALLDREGSESQKDSYRENYNRFMKYVRHENITHLSIAHIDIDHAKGYRTFLIQQLKLAKKTINASLGSLTYYWDFAIENKLTNKNPFKSVMRVKKQTVDRKVKRDRFEPLTFHEMKIIFEHLEKLNEQNFITYLYIIFYAWIRPVEIERLTPAAISFDESIEEGDAYITLKGQQTKNGNRSIVQVVKPLRKRLINHLKQASRPDDFLFSTNGMAPGAKKLHRDDAREKWRLIVKEHLKIDKDMYALKHTGNIEYLKNNKGNLDLKWQQMQNRHASPTQTETYNKKLGAYFIKVADIKFREF